MYKEKHGLSQLLINKQSYLNEPTCDLVVAENELSDVGQGDYKKNRTHIRHSPLKIDYGIIPVVNY